MNGEKLEAYLAKLYVDDRARARFLADPRAEARAAGLSEEQCAALASIDFIGLQMAADSFAKKRAAQARQKPRSLLSRWLHRG